MAEGGGICGRLLNLGFEQHPKRSFGLVGVGSGDLPERVRETLKDPRITLSDSFRTEQVRYGASSEACSYVPPILAILVVLVTK